ncbi:glycosyltransferase [Colwellia echini]|uniref:Glycosyltransferase n=1 Tax=Colwellia echini TaxID=1982103 RepID=A0ABY3MUN8_9GAMM|nr:glycosyltransferase [Colwellia echini]TYK64777.1 glycosyltransferase [Colwellia echini]
MKIIFRISKLGFGGAEQVFISVARELSKTHPITIIFAVDSEQGDNVTHVKSLGFEVVSLNASRTLNSIVPLAKLITKEKPDVVISAYTDTNAACLLSKVIARYKVPVIVSEHAALNEHWQFKSNSKKKVLRFYVGWVYKLADKVLCVSKGLEQQVNLLLKQPSKTLTIYNPVRFNGSFNKGLKNENDEKNETQVIKNIESARVLRLVAVGRVVPQKDYSTLIKAISIIKQQQNVHLNIVGGTTDKKEFNKVKSLVAEYGLEKTIEFVGYSDAVETYYKKADVFVLSSAWEGFGNVIVEAMSFGLPIVSTNCNYGPAEILIDGKYGRLAEVGDSESLAKIIIKEALDPLVTGETLIKRSKDFSEEIIASQYYELINEVIKHDS